MLADVGGEPATSRAGFILKDGRIEVNCTFDALGARSGSRPPAEVAKLLFPEA